MHMKYYNMFVIGHIFQNELEFFDFCIFYSRKREYLGLTLIRIDLQDLVFKVMTKLPPRGHIVAL